LERLEPRDVPAVVEWTGAVNSNWFNAANWDVNEVPSLTDHVVLDGSQVNQPNIPTNTSALIGSIQSSWAPLLTINGSLRLTGLSAKPSKWMDGLMRIGGTLTVAGFNTTFDWKGGEIQGTDLLNSRINVQENATLNVSEAPVRLSTTIHVGSDFGPGTMVLSGMTRNLMFGPGAGIVVGRDSDLKFAQATNSDTMGGIRQNLSNEEYNNWGYGYIENYGRITRTVVDTGDASKVLKIDTSIRNWDKSVLALNPGTSMEVRSPGRNEGGNLLFLERSQLWLRPGSALYTEAGTSMGQYSELRVYGDSVGNTDTTATLGGNLNLQYGTIRLGVNSNGFSTLFLATGSLVLESSTVYVRLDGATNGRSDRIVAPMGTITISNTGFGEATLMVETRNITPPVGASYSIFFGLQYNGDFTLVGFSGAALNYTRNISFLQYWLTFAG
jgi:hypothetical protein